jgi:glycosyltransferase involved in cell wall biosynthesis
MTAPTTNTPRVLVGSDFFTPHWTGIVKSIANVIESLTGEIEFTVVTSRYSSELPAQERIGNSVVFREGVFVFLSRCAYSWRAIIRFIREVPRHDAVLISSPCSNVLPFSIIAKLCGKRLVIFHQGDLILAQGFFNRVLEGVFFVSTTIGLALADLVSTFTADYAETSSVLRWFKHKFRPLMVPVCLAPPPQQLSPLLQRAVELKQQGRILFGLAGRFVAEKGFDILLAAVPRILEKVPNAHFVFAGETNISYESTFHDLKSQVERYSDRFLMLGLLRDEELRAFYEAIDFIVIPSRSDCCNLVQLEACTCGKPSVCADIPGARHLVRTSGFGAIFAKEDPIDLADKIADVVARRDELLPRHAIVLQMLDTKARMLDFKDALLG